MQYTIAKISSHRGAYLEVALICVGNDRSIEVENPHRIQDQGFDGRLQVSLFSIPDEPDARFLCLLIYRAIQLNENDPQGMQKTFTCPRSSILIQSWTSRCLSSSAIPRRGSDWNRKLDVDFIQRICHRVWYLYMNTMLIFKYSS
jgi:hypothetical protein